MSKMQESLFRFGIRHTTHSRTANSLQSVFRPFEMKRGPAPFIYKASPRLVLNVQTKQFYLTRSIFADLLNVPEISS